jgi:hypothetical protein
MPVSVVKVENKNQLKKFARFGYELYKDNPYYVPELFEDVVLPFSGLRVFSQEVIVASKVTVTNRVKVFLFIFFALISVNFFNKNNIFCFFF